MERCTTEVQRRLAVTLEELERLRAGEVHETFVARGVQYGEVFDVVGVEWAREHEREYYGRARVVALVYRGQKRRRARFVLEDKPS